MDTPPTLPNAQGTNRSFNRDALPISGMGKNLTPGGTNRTCENWIGLGKSQSSGRGFKKTFIHFAF